MATIAVLGAGLGGVLAAYEIKSAARPEEIARHAGAMTVGGLVAWTRQHLQAVQRMEKSA